MHARQPRTARAHFLRPAALRATIGRNVGVWQAKASRACTAAMLGSHKETLYRAVSAARPPGGPDQAAAGGIPGAGHDLAQPAPGRLAGHPLAGTSPTPADPEPALLCAPTPATDRQAMRTKSAIWSVLLPGRSSRTVVQAGCSRQARSRWMCVGPERAAASADRFQIGPDQSSASARRWPTQRVKGLAGQGKKDKRCPAASWLAGFLGQDGLTPESGPPLPASGTRPFKPPVV